MPFERTNWARLGLRIGLLALCGCRQLFVPDAPDDSVALGSSILVRHPNGTYVTGLELELFQDQAPYGLVSRGLPALTQRGFDAIVYFDVPEPGSYVLWIGSTAAHDDFVVHDAQLPAALDIVAPYESLAGTVSFPVGFDWQWAATARLDIWTKPRDPRLSTSSSYSQQLGASLAADDSFQAWLSPGSYRPEIDLFSPDTSFELLLPAAIHPSPTPLTVPVPVQPIDLSLDLLGQMASGFEVQLDVFSNSLEDAVQFRFGTILPLQGTPERIWLPAGLHELSISSPDTAFLPRRTFLRVPIETPPTIELGRFLVQLLCLDAAGGAVEGLDVRLRSSGGSLSTGTDANGSVEFAAMPGLVQLTLENVRYPDLEIQGDAVFEFIWP